MTTVAAVELLARARTLGAAMRARAPLDGLLTLAIRLRVGEAAAADEALPARAHGGGDVAGDMGLSSVVNLVPVAAGSAAARGDAAGRVPGGGAACCLDEVIGMAYHAAVAAAEAEAAANAGRGTAGGGNASKLVARNGTHRGHHAHARRNTT